MGLVDFSAVFDALDATCCGFLTLEQVQDFYTQLHMQPVSLKQVQASIEQICGASSQGDVHKEFFLSVLQELDRRMNLQDKLRWDFMSLDLMGNGRIVVQDALLLFQVTHGDSFSTYNWNKFLASRADPNDDVCFDEVASWLCNLPQDGCLGGCSEPCKGECKLDPEELKKRLEEEQKEAKWKDYLNKKKMQEDEDSVTAEAKEQEEYRERTKRAAKKKLNQLDKKLGLEGDEDEEENAKKRNRVGFNDILDALDLKYDSLRRKLFWEMIKKHMGEAAFSVLTDEEQLAKFEQLQLRERQMRKEDVLPEQVDRLYGATVVQILPLEGMMGEVSETHTRRETEAHDTRLKLKAEGKSDAEIDNAIRSSYETFIKEQPSGSSKIILRLQERHLLEKNRFIGEGHKKFSSSEMMVELCKLVRENALLETEGEFQTSATAVGLAERPQSFKSIRYDFDRERQETVALNRLVECQGKKGVKVSVDDGDPLKGRTVGVVDLQVETVMEIGRKHANERQVLIQLLQGKDSNHAKNTASRMSAEQRQAQLKILRNQRMNWRDNTPEYMHTRREVQIKILQEAVGLYVENRRDELEKSQPNISDLSVLASVLADLQQKQDQEADSQCILIQNKDEKVLNRLRKAERTARKDEYLDNLSAVILGTFEYSEEEKRYVRALEQKYDTLRDRLFWHVLKLEYREEWRKMSDEEQRRQVAKKKNEELKLRQEMNFEGMASLLGGQKEYFNSVRALFGENAREYRQRMEQLFEKEQTLALQGQTLESIDDDEINAEKIQSTNLLADLAHRFFDDVDEIVTWLRSQESQSKSEYERKLPLVRIHREKRLASNDQRFETVAYMVGLAERINASLDKRHRADQSRQRELARLHMVVRTARVSIGLPYQKQLDEKYRPSQGETASWMEAVLKEVDKNHIEERELMLKMLQDESLDELREVAMEMTPAERQKRLAELKTKRHMMTVEDAGEREENMCILEEAAAIKYVCKQLVLIGQQGGGGSGGEAADKKEVVVVLLAELLLEQDREVAAILNKLPHMSEPTMHVCWKEQVDRRKWDAANNVVTVLTKYEGPGEDEKIIKALEEKYDSLRDKLLAEMLMKQMGQAEWDLLGEQERQRKLLQLKLLERKLRREGKLDELRRLLGDAFDTDENLKKLMGDSRAEYERRLKERLARRQARRAQGLESDDEEEEEEDQNEGKKGNPFEDLNGRFEEEKEALLARLRGMNNDFMSEKERQAELLRLRREKRQAAREDKFENAAMLIGLAERHQAEADEKMKKDRLRQEQLARERLEALRRKRAEGRKGPEDADDVVLREGDSTDLQEAVLNLLEKKHVGEQELLMQLLGNSRNDEDIYLKASAASEQERQDLQDDLRERYKKVSPENASENHRVLQEGAVIKLEGRRDMMSRQKDGHPDLSDDDVCVSLMADLQEEQQTESDKMIEDMAEKNESDLVDLQRGIIMEKKNERGRNVASVVFSHETGTKGGEDALITALEGKYDALRDKLIADSLMQQIGESEWQQLSEQERQRKLLQLKLEERKLRREGKYDEAAQLLGAALQDQENLQKLMGDNRQLEQQRIKDRLGRRRTRMAEGISEEECDKLEEEEKAEEEEEDKKRRKNVLLDLQYRLDEERDELLRRLREGDDKLAKERARQAELARLKREQRKARQEEKFDAAAIVLGMAQKGEKVLEEERERQKRLARERLAARRKNRANQKADEAAAEVALPEDETDPVAMQEAILKEVEQKHLQERDVLLQMLQEDAGESDMRKEAKLMSQEERDEKLEELRELRQFWRDSGASDPDEQMDIFKEATSVRAVTLKEKSRSGEEEEDDDDDAVIVSLLADLQEGQDKETQMLISDLTEKSPQTLKQLKMVQAMARKQQWYDNLANTLLSTDQPIRAQQEGEPLSEEEEKLVKALEEKYDAARDQLLAESLMQQVGEAEWSHLSERERQAKLVKLKLQERKLRQQGKYDEAAALLGQAMHNQDEMSRRLGDSRSEQKERLQERLRRRQELKAEREAKGLSTDENTLDTLQIQEDAERDQEEEGNKNRNILADLDMHLEDEKNALLAGLRGQDERLRSERQRQFELARLRREKKTLQTEGRFHTAAILINMAKTSDEARMKNMAKERERQRQLAKDRLKARKDRHATRAEQDRKLLADKLRLELAEQAMKDAMATDDLGELQECVLFELEQKHSSERDILIELIDAAKHDAQDTDYARNMPTHELKLELTKLHQEREAWRSASNKEAVRFAQSQASKSAEDLHLVKVAEEREKQFHSLTKAVVLNIEVQRKEHLKNTPESSDEEMHEEISVAMVTELQQKQNAESLALNKVLIEQDEETLAKVKDMQRMARREGWLDNVMKTIFSLYDDAADTVSLPDEAALLKEMEEEFEKDKQELEKTAPGGDIDMEAALKKLEAEQEAKRKALNEALVKQREATKAKLEARRRARENKEYESEAATQLLLLAQKSGEALERKTEQDRSKQSNMMQQRLAARREARRKEEAAQREREESFVSTESTLTSRPSTSDSALLGLGLYREKTVVDVQVSESEKEQLVTRLVQQQNKVQKRKAEEQSRQAEALKQRRERMKDKRGNQAAALISLGERQKSNLEKALQEQKDHQITMVKERVARKRYERTMTMKEKSDKMAKQFDQLLTHNEKEGLTQDEKMALAAKKMQEKFRMEEELVNEGKKSTNIHVSQESSRKGHANNENHLTAISENMTADSEGSTASDNTMPQGGKSLTDKQRMELLKQRRSAKKRTRKAAATDNQENQSEA